MEEEEIKSAESNAISEDNDAMKNENDGMVALLEEEMVVSSKNDSNNNNNGINVELSLLKKRKKKTINTDDNDQNDDSNRMMIRKNKSMFVPSSTMNDDGMIISKQNDSNENGNDECNDSNHDSDAPMKKEEESNVANAHRQRSTSSSSLSSSSSSSSSSSVIIIKKEKKIIRMKKSTNSKMINSGHSCTNIASSNSSLPSTQSRSLSTPTKNFLPPHPSTAAAGSSSLSSSMKNHGICGRRPVSKEEKEVIDLLASNSLKNQQLRPNSAQCSPDAIYDSRTSDEGQRLLMDMIQDSQMTQHTNQHYHSQQQSPPVSHANGHLPFVNLVPNLTQSWKSGLPAYQAGLSRSSPFVGSLPLVSAASTSGPASSSSSSSASADPLRSQVSKKRKNLRLSHSHRPSTTNSAAGFSLRSLLPETLPPVMLPLVHSSANQETLSQMARRVGGIADCSNDDANSKPQMMIDQLIGDHHHSAAAAAADAMNGTSRLIGKKRRRKSMNADGNGTKQSRGKGAHSMIIRNNQVRSDESFVCNICHRTCANKRGLGVHMSRAHGKTIEDNNALDRALQEHRVKSNGVGGALFATVSSSSTASSSASSSLSSQSSSSSSSSSSSASSSSDGGSESGSEFDPTDPAGSLQWSSVTGIPHRRKKMRRINNHKHHHNNHHSNSAHHGIRLTLDSLRLPKMTTPTRHRTAQLPFSGLFGGQTAPVLASDPRSSALMSNPVAHDHHHHHHHRNHHAREESNMIRSNQVSPDDDSEEVPTMKSGSNSESPSQQRNHLPHIDSDPDNCECPLCHRRFSSHKNMKIHWTRTCSKKAGHRYSSSSSSTTTMMKSGPSSRLITFKRMAGSDVSMKSTLAANSANQNSSKKNVNSHPIKAKQQSHIANDSNPRRESDPKLSTPAPMDPMNTLHQCRRPISFSAPVSGGPDGPSAHDRPARNSGRMAVSSAARPGGSSTISPVSQQSGFLVRPPTMASGVHLSGTMLGSEPGLIRCPTCGECLKSAHLEPHLVLFHEFQDPTESVMTLIRGNVNTGNRSSNSSDDTVKSEQPLPATAVDMSGLPPLQRVIEEPRSEESIGDSDEVMIEEHKQDTDMVIVKNNSDEESKDVVSSSSISTTAYDECQDEMDVRQCRVRLMLLKQQLRYSECLREYCKVAQPLEREERARLKRRVDQIDERLVTFERRSQESADNAAMMAVRINELERQINQHAMKQRRQSDPGQWRYAEIVEFMKQHEKGRCLEIVPFARWLRKYKKSLRGGQLQSLNRLWLNDVGVSDSDSQNVVLNCIHAMFTTALC